MKIFKLLDLAISIAVETHKETFDRGGNPYILHPLHVMNSVAHLGPEFMVVGILHDTVEDSEKITINYLRAYGFDEYILTALDLVTHKKEDSYTEYIIKIEDNTIAREVKKADLKHNSDLSRLKGLKDKDFQRTRKYSISYKFLSGGIDRSEMLRLLSTGEEEFPSVTNSHGDLIEVGRTYYILSSMLLITDVIVRSLRTLDGIGTEALVSTKWVNVDRLRIKKEDLDER